MFGSAVREVIRKGRIRNRHALTYAYACMSTSTSTHTNMDARNMRNEELIDALKRTDTKEAALSYANLLGLGNNKNDVNIHENVKLHVNREEVLELLHACKRTRSFRLAKRIIMECKDKTNMQIDDIVGLCKDVGLADMSVKLLEQIKQEGASPSLEAFLSAMGAASRLGDSKTLWNVYEDLLLAGVRPSLSLYTQIARVGTRVMKQQSHSQHAHVTHAGARSNKHSQRGSGQQQPHSIGAETIVIPRDGRKKAEMLINRLLREEKITKVLGAEHQLVLFLLGGNFTKAQKLLRFLEEEKAVSQHHYDLFLETASAHTPNAHVSAVRDGVPSLLLKVLERMLAAGYGPTEDVFVKLMELSAKSQYHTTMYRTALDSKLLSPAFCAHGMTAALLQNKEWRRALSLAEEHAFQLPGAAFVCLINSCARGGRHREVMEIFDLMDLVANSTTDEANGGNISVKESISDPNLIRTVMDSVRHWHNNEVIQSKSSEEQAQFAEEQSLFALRIAIMAINNVGGCDGHVPIIAVDRALAVCADNSAAEHEVLAAASHKGIIMRAPGVPILKELWRTGNNESTDINLSETSRQPNTFDFHNFSFLMAKAALRILLQPSHIKTAQFRPILPPARLRHLLRARGLNTEGARGELVTRLAQNECDLSRAEVGLRHADPSFCMPPQLVPNEGVVITGLEGIRDQVRIFFSLPISSEDQDDESSLRISVRS